MARPRWSGPRARAWGLAVLAATLVAAPIEGSAAAGRAGRRPPAGIMAPPAGTFVDNAATGQGIDAISGGTAATTSNTVRAIVGVTEMLTLAADRAAAPPPGATTVLAHRLVNTGNAATDVRLDLLNLAGDDFDAVGLALWHDLDGNGALGPADVGLVPGDTLSLPLGAAADLLVAATVPPGAGAGARALLRLEATSMLQSVTVANVDTLAVAVAPQPVVLFVEKLASPEAGEPGDLIEYLVRVANRSDSALAAVTVQDALPHGFVYEPATARRDGVVLADPPSRGPRLVFAIGALGPGAVTALRYRARLGVGAGDGDGVNRAWAEAGTVRSNEARARVILNPGVFADEATIVGTVFVDRDHDRRRGGGDLGVPGVTMVLDDGTFAVTDRDGQYSFYGLPPRTHALRPDPASTPAGARLVALDHRGAGSGIRMVDLQRGDFQRADFAFAGDSAVLLAVQTRLEEATRADDLARGLHRQLPIDAIALLPGDPKARPVSGLVDDERAAARPAAPAPPAGGVPAAPASAVADRDSDDDALQPGAWPAPVHNPDAATLDRALDHADATSGFLGLAHGDTARSERIAVRVKGARHAAFELRVGGILVPTERVGRRVTRLDLGVTVWEYVGVPLRPGVNHLEVVERDPTGRERGRAAADVLLADRLARIEIVAPAAAIADGRSTVALQVRALDARGLEPAGRTFVTLVADRGVWRTPDLDPSTPGLQVAIDDGTATVELTAPGDPGTATLRAAAGSARAERAIAFAPALRQLMVVGTVEGVVSLERPLQGASRERALTGFEDPITTFADARGDGRGAAAARAALFVKGRVRDDMLLTLGYDSERPDDERRFRDLQPDAFYPVYGDGSVRGYEAQSTGNLYARLDRGSASLLYGDFVTRGAGGTRGLAGYSRSLTGVQQRIENPRMRLEAFTSRERTRGRVEELPGLGISGPYRLGVAPIVENSEQIEIVTRDRNQPSVVIRAEPRARFSDYTMDAVTGEIVFKSPVPSVDAALNPVYVRVAYELAEGGDAYWISGAEARFKPAERLEIGGTYVDDHDVTSPYELRGAFAGARIGDHTAIEGEYAMSRRAGIPGDGARLELRHDGAKVQARAWGSSTDAAFSNPTSGFGPGRSEAGTHFSLRLAERSRIFADGIYSAAREGAASNGGLLLALDQGLGEALRAEVGMRYSVAEDDSGVALPDGVSLRGRLLVQVPSRPEVSAFAELEQDVRDPDRKLAAVGGEYRFHARSRVYLRHELISSRTGPWALDPTVRNASSVLGIDADLGGEAHLFNEYRLADALAGRDAEAAFGLRNAWTMERWRVNATFERVSPLSGDGSPSTAVTGALETMEDEDVKASARVEVRTSRGSDAVLGTAGLAVRMNRAWTMLGRNIVTLTDERSAGMRLRERLQIGFAYRRPDVDAWDGLARYEVRVDRDPEPSGPPRRRFVHVLSAHGTGRLFEDVVTTLSWAGKVVRETGPWPPVTSGAQRVLVRGTHDLGEHWDAGVTVSALFSGAGERRDGYGVEIGRRLPHGAWMSAGWNRSGYRDDDLPDEAWTREGFYLRIRAAFDETMFTGEEPRP